MKWEDGISSKNYFHGECFTQLSFQKANVLLKRCLRGARKVEDFLSSQNQKTNKQHYKMLILLHSGIFDKIILTALDAPQCIMVLSHISYLYFHFMQYANINAAFTNNAMNTVTSLVIYISICKPDYLTKNHFTKSPANFFKFNIKLHLFVLYKNFKYFSSFILK